MRLERFYENTEILHVNTEPDRCYYLPCDAFDFSGALWYAEKE